MPSSPFGYDVTMASQRVSFESDFFSDAVVDRSAVLIYTHTTGRGNCNAIAQQWIPTNVEFSVV